MTEPVPEVNVPVFPPEVKKEEEKPQVPPHEPILSRPRWGHDYRWVLFLFVALVIGLVFYVGWDIVRFWQNFVNRITGAE
jgi:hypothetical protein